MQPVLAIANRAALEAAPLFTGGEGGVGGDQLPVGTPVDRGSFTVASPILPSPRYL